MIVKDHLTRLMVRYSYQYVNIIDCEYCILMHFYATLLASYIFSWRRQSMTIGARIKALRQKKGWSQRELARLAGVRHATLVELETGMRTGTRIHILRRLAKPSCVTTRYLTGIYKNKESPGPPTVAF